MIYRLRKDKTETCWHMPRSQEQNAWQTNQSYLRQTKGFQGRTVACSIWDAHTEMEAEGVYTFI